jgi:quinol monooxygenase YgiN
MRAISFAVVLCLLVLVTAQAQERKEEGPDLATRLKDVKGPFTVIVPFKIKKSEVKKFLAVAKPVIAATRKEKGCVRYELYQDLDNPSNFTFYERWRSPEALKKHMEEPHTKKILQALEKFGEGEPRIILAQIVSVGD